MSFGNVPSLPGGAHWGQQGPGTGNLLLDMALQMGSRSFFGMQLGQFWPTQNIGDTFEAQQFSQFNMGSAMYSAGHTSMGNSFFDGSGSPLSDSTLNKAMGNAGMIAPFFPAIYDAVGLGGVAYNSNIAGTQRRFLGRNMTQDQIGAAGKHLGEVTSGAYNTLYDHKGDPLKNTYGYRGGMLGQLVSAGDRLGWGPGNLMGMDKDAASQKLAGYSQQMGQLGSSVRDIDSRFAGLNAEQTVALAQGLNLGGRGMSTEEMSKHIRMMSAYSKLSDTDVDLLHGEQIQAGQYAKAIGGRMEQGTAAIEHAGAASRYYGKMGKAGQDAAMTSKEEFRQQDEQLTVQAQNSMVGGQMSALMAAGKSGQLKKGSKAEEAYNKLAEGEYQYMDESAFQDLAKGSGFTSSEWQRNRMNDKVNTKKYGKDIAEQARNSQWDVDIAPNMQVGVMQAIGERAGKNSGAYASTITQAIRDSGGKTEKEAKENVVKALMEKHGVSKDDAEKMAFSGMGAADEVAQQGFGYNNALNAAGQNSKEMQKDVAETKAQATEIAESGDKNASKGQMQVPQRLAEAAKLAVKGDIMGAFKMIANDVMSGASTAAPSGTTGGAAGPAGAAGGAAGPAGAAGGTTITNNIANPVPVKLLEHDTGGPPGASGVAAAGGTH